MSKKRFLSIVLSAVMILSLACSALAVGQSGRYIGNSTVNGSIYQTYYQVDKHSTQSTSEGSSLPKTGTPYSSKDLEDSEGVKQRRYYDKNGNADMDIDYRHGEQAIRFPIDMIGTMAYEGLHIKENNCEQRTV